MGATQRNLRRDLAWTVAGASVGSLARCWVDSLYPANIVVLTSFSAILVGYAAVGSGRLSMPTVLSAGGGAAGSVSAAGVRAVVATPMHSMIGVAGYFVAAVTGMALGMMLASVVANRAAKERV